MRTPTKIDRRWLMRHKACAKQRERFLAEWPDGADLTRANLLRAVELELDLVWFADAVLTASAERAYHDAIAPAERAYHDAIAPARRAYHDAIAPARRAYHDAIALALGDALGLPEEVAA